MTTKDQPQSSDETSFFNNQQLFSDYYLNERMQGHREWSEDEEASEAAFQKALVLYRDAKLGLEKANEAQTEDDFIKPLIRDVLGLYYDVQPTATMQGKRNRPDYALFTNEEDANAAKQVRDKEGEYYALADLVADAKYWRRPLDTAGDAAREQLSNANPSFQIVNYLVATGAAWGVLTNGAIWRLYSTRARSRVDTYYEVDLASILEAGDSDAFHYFYFFFRGQAFKRDPHSDQSFLEAIYEGSVNYGVSLQKRLKELIFDEIFLLLSAGFLDKMGVDDPDQEQLDEIFQGTLRLLYRLLFLLHAESRDLLPVQEHAYYGYSLLRMQRDAAKALDHGRTLSGVSADLWNDLKGLFRIIDQGDADINVPRYNGGLFRRDDSRNAFLETHEIPDKYLYPALLLLTRETDPESGRRRFVDYKDLDVEQLGSIYEGLLEFHLRYEPSETTRLKASGLVTSLILINDKGERKATGSYYTPHYIVEYIVENTLGSVLETREADFRALMAEIEPLRERLAATEVSLAQDPKQRDGAVGNCGDERTGLNRELIDLESRALEALLGIRVCDPAMGSGHFLVEAVDWLAEHLIALINEYPENPIEHRLHEIRTRILKELEAEGISIPSEKLKDTNLLKRMVMKRCIYGVDLNPMAVELAKLSLWLDSFTVGAPLSFLDHHLKLGNSLIGARVEDVRVALEEEETGQIHMFGGPFAGLLTATELICEVALRTDATLEEVTQSAEKYQAFEKAMRPYKRVLDLWISRNFGNDQAEDLLRDPGMDVLQMLVEDGRLAYGYQVVVQQARALWLEKRFFHWELEFPEAFIDLEKGDWRENPGFDAVIGNPPYISVTNIPGDQRSFLLKSYQTASGRFDIYIIFVERGLGLIRACGFLSYIMPIKWAVYSNGEALRDLLLDEYTLISILDVSQSAIFLDPSTYPCIPVICREKPESDQRISLFHPPYDHPKIIMHGNTYLRERGYSSEIPIERYKQIPQKIMSPLLRDDEWEIYKKLSSKGVLLEDLFYVEQCIRIGSEEKRDKLVSTSPERMNSKDIHPVIDGQNIKPYFIEWDGRFLDYKPDVLYNPKSKEILEQPKILIKRIAEKLTAAYDTGTGNGFFYPLNTIYALINKNGNGSNPLYYVALLNSKLLDWIYKVLFVAIGIRGGYIEFREYLRYLPLRKIPSTTPEDQIQIKIIKAKDNYKKSLEDNDYSGLFKFIDNLIANDQFNVIKEFMIFLANEMIVSQTKRHDIGKALDPFKFLDNGVDFMPFYEVFSEEIKYGERVRDLGEYHHDIDGLKLVPLDDHNTWELHVQLKLRDPEQDWKGWQYEQGGNSIKREWVPVYRFRMDGAKARYYQHAFPVRELFTHADSLPGGYTRTTQRKLELSTIPAYDPQAVLTPLVELAEELEEVEQRIRLTKDLIDQIVYKLYGLTEEEVAIVEETMQ